MTKDIIGIDPGCTGAIAHIWGDELVAVYPMPVHTIIKTKTVVSEITGKKGKRNTVYATHVDGDRLGDMLDEMYSHFPNARFFLEKVTAMPKQGVSSTFKFGRSFGAVEGVLGALGLDIDYVAPRMWKKDLGVTAGKDTSIALAKEVFPYFDFEPETEKPKKHFAKESDRAEAALIAYWGLTIGVNK